MISFFALDHIGNKSEMIIFIELLRRNLSLGLNIGQIKKIVNGDIVVEDEEMTLIVLGGNIGKRNKLNSIVCGLRIGTTIGAGFQAITQVKLGTENSTVNEMLHSFVVPAEQNPIAVSNFKTIKPKMTHHYGKDIMVADVVFKYRVGSSLDLNNGVVIKDVRKCLNFGEIKRAYQQLPEIGAKQIQHHVKRRKKDKEEADYVKQNLKRKKVNTQSNIGMKVREKKRKVQ